MRSASRLLWAVSLLAASGCASTRMTSLINPDSPTGDLTRVAVIYLTSDLEYRELVEGRFANHAGDTEFVAGHLLLFPGRAYSEPEVQEIFLDNGIDAVLVVELLSTGASTSRSPGVSETSCTIWSSSKGCQQTETVSYGGGTISKPQAGFRLLLVDRGMTTIHWTATANSGGNAYAGMSDLLNSLVDKAVGKLEEDGLIRGGAG